VQIIPVESDIVQRSVWPCNENCFLQ